LFEGLSLSDAPLLCLLCGEMNLEATAASILVYTWFTTSSSDSADPKYLPIKKSRDLLAVSPVVSESIVFTAVTYDCNQQSVMDPSR
jgi:hypothetical protein